MPVGRPTDYTPEVAETILGRLRDGETLNAICRAAELPHESTVRLWVRDNREGFTERYTQARLVGYLHMADELVEIADDGRNDWMVRQQKVGEEEIDVSVPNPEAIGRSRLRIDTRKWLLAKALPKVFGEKLVLGGDPDAPLNVAVDDRELARRVAFLLAKAQPPKEG